MIKYAVIMMDDVPEDQTMGGTWQCLNPENTGFTDIKEAEKRRIEVIKEESINPTNVSVIQYVT